MGLLAMFFEVYALSGNPKADSAGMGSKRISFVPTFVNESQEKTDEINLYFTATKIPHMMDDYS